VLSAFLLGWHRSGDVLAAWQEHCWGYSTDSAYRWVRKFLLNQGLIRERLCRLRAPPGGNSVDAAFDVFAHLELTLGKQDFIRAFQEQFQVAWPA